MIVDSSGSRKTNAFLKLVSHHPDTDKIYLYATDPYEPKYQPLIKACEDASIKHYNDPRVFIEYSNTTDDIYNNINNLTQTKTKQF